MEYVRMEKYMMLEAQQYSKREIKKSVNIWNTHSMMIYHRYYIEDT